MILRVPEYYEKFSCIASRCKDSCCAGWEIDIDEDSYAYYNSVEGKFGKRLKESMYEADPDDDGGGYRFKLKGKKRCAMLNDHNLCDLYTALGEEALCEVCTEYPRFSLIYGDVEQKALSLSCEEVGRILFERTEPEKLVDIELPGNCDDGEDDPAYVAFMEWVQQESVNILQNRTHNIPEPALLEAKPYESFQFVREGFFCADYKDSKPGAPVFNRIVSLKSSFKLPKK